MIRWREIMLLVFAAGSIGARAPAGQWIDAPIVEAIARIEFEASLVHSAKADFTVNFLPTTAAEMERIAALCKQRGQEYRAGSYYCSGHQARRRSYHSVWYRKGVQEREEKTYIARPAIIETTVFDGSLVKVLDSTPGRSCLYLASPASHWTQKNRIQPFAFAFEFRTSPHAEIIRQSPERRAVRQSQTADASCELLLKHPSEERLILRLVFDEQHRLTEREAILTRSSSTMVIERDEPTVYARHEFSDYRSYDDGRGRRIWFPSRAVLRYYLGKLADGTPVQSFAMTVDIGDIEFNGAIADEKFTLAVPEGVPVHDHRQDGFATVALSY